MTANDGKYYLGCFSTLVDEYNNTLHHSIYKIIIHVDYSPLSGETDANHKDPKFKVDDRVRITK